VRDATRGRVKVGEVVEVKLTDTARRERARQVSEVDTRLVKEFQMDLQ
jgi:hypothetical protein